MAIVRDLEGAHWRASPPVPAADMTDSRSTSRRVLRGLDALNFLLADVATGVGPFLAIYLAGYKWDEERVGLALSAGGIAGTLINSAGNVAATLSVLDGVGAGIFGVVSVLVIADLTRPETRNA